MARIERATSPLPRGCSTTEPHGHRYGSGDVWLEASSRQTRNDVAEQTWNPEPSVERETGIEPVSLAWKAKVLPLNYSRPAKLPSTKKQHTTLCSGANQDQLHFTVVEEAGFEPAYA